MNKAATCSDPDCIITKSNHVRRMHGLTQISPVKLCPKDKGKINKYKGEYQLKGKASCKTNDADQVMNCVVKSEFDVEEAAYQVIYKISYGNSQNLPLSAIHNINSFHQYV